MLFYSSMDFINSYRNDDKYNDYLPMPIGLLTEPIEMHFDF